MSDNIFNPINEGLNPLISHLCLEIQTIPHLVDQGIHHSDAMAKIRSIESTAVEIIKQFGQEEVEILANFEPWLIPFAKEVLDQFYGEANALNRDLVDRLRHPHQSTPETWIEHASQWEQLYSRWQNRRKLMEDVLDMISVRERGLIDHDIHIIEEYQNHGIADCVSEELPEIKERIRKAIENPLNDLLKLKKTSNGPSSLLEAGNWLANFRSLREDYFNESLSCIDRVIKENLMTGHEIKSAEFINDFEGELTFIEHEFKHLINIIKDKESLDHESQALVVDQINSLVEIIETHEKESLPENLKKRLIKLQESVNDINIDKWLFGG